MTHTTTTEERFKEKFQGIKSSEHPFGDTAQKQVFAFIEDEKRIAREGEYQFFFNILKGVDIADEQTGNTSGGTKAIRLALMSRYNGFPSQEDPNKQDNNN